MPYPMDDDRDLRDFAGTCRLFPLPGVVLFPHNIRPLHIFEPRYRQMTEDALATDRLIAIAQIAMPVRIGDDGEPVLEEVACLARILQHERLPDGRFNFLLLGLRRVRLTREVAEGKLYRVSEAELLDDAEPAAHSAAAKSEELTRLFRSLLGRAEELDPDLGEMLDSGLPLGALTDVMAHALGLPAAIKQALLDEARVDARADLLLTVLRQVAAASAPSPAASGQFPPPFSPN